MIDAYHYMMPAYLFRFKSYLEMFKLQIIITVYCFSCIHKPFFHENFRFFHFIFYSLVWFRILKSFGNAYLLSCHYFLSFLLVYEIINIAYSAKITFFNGMKYLITHSLFNFMSFNNFSIFYLFTNISV